MKNCGYTTKYINAGVYTKPPHTKAKRIRKDKKEKIKTYTLFDLILLIFKKFCDIIYMIKC